MAEEAFIITQMLEWGVDLVHLRKPGAGYDACAKLLTAIPQPLRYKIVTHEHFALADEFQLHGIHLNRRNPIAPEHFMGSKSCSCHSLQEVECAKKKYDYVFLSPIFDSISKKGYKTTFNDDLLYAASRNGTIDDKVIALGGVSAAKIPLLQHYGFGGAALLGDVWNRVGDKDFEQYIRNLKTFKKF